MEINYHDVFFSLVNIVKHLHCCEDMQTRNNDETKWSYEPQHEISNNVVCGTSNGSDQPAHTRSLIRAFACHLNIL